MVFDHIGFTVADFARSRAFFVAALKPLGIDVLAEGDGWALIGRAGDSKLWVGTGELTAGSVHVGFSAATREQVRQFHAAALAAGGLDNGAPGLRPQYSPTYYGAFVFDPDGNNIEAVCRADGE
jgi:catechol 2,3-dioxygenase-like lactoylglutathione lyase family enzyme